MKREYSYILIAYVAMQLLGFVAIPLITFLAKSTGMSHNEAELFAIPLWIVGSFLVTLLITLFFLRSEIKNYRTIRTEEDLSPLKIFLWSFGGMFLAMFAQSMAINLEQLIGIKPGSENTQNFVQLIKAFPIIIIVTSVIGPILEEIVFRKILFGSLYKKVNFLLAALISSLIFAVAHNELEHLILYTAMGMTFAFLYVKTKRIIVPIIAHIAMNTFVVIVQITFSDQLEQLIDQLEQINCIIGGF